ncbi:MAG: tRNA lysidine(34) synthetase TilS [Gemmatimonadetes bacterium]|nr:tRNA lysidine(34) synthetase TilS [Gemmatimonadota bacterium]
MIGALGMGTVRERFDRALARLGPGPATALVAVSGGPDSIALLDLAATAGPGCGFTWVVAHFDHGIHPDSADVAARVAAAAGRYGLEYRSHRTILGPDATETTARRARLAWLHTVAVETGAKGILTGHHRDDQVETMVMRFLNGSGPSGLVGIRPHWGRWLRPLLEVSRQEIEAYLAERGLASWVDPGNADQRHLRSWVRHELLPRIERRVPRVRENLMAAAGVFEVNRRGWDDLLGQLSALEFQTEVDGVSVAADPLKGYSSAVVRSLLKALGFRLDVGLGKGQLDRLQRLVVKGHTGQMVDLVGGGRGELAFGRLKLSRGLAHRPEYRATISGPDQTAEAGDWRVTSGRSTPPEVMPRDGFTTWVQLGVCLVARPWRAGDRIRPIRGRGSRLVVRCMQDQEVPRSHRLQWPVIEHEGVVVWVPGVCRSDGLLPDPSALAMRIDVSSR